MIFNAIFDEDPLSLKHSLSFGECTSLSRPTDLGNTPIYLAIAKQKKKILYLLFKEGLDFQVYCDKLRFGTPLYYAIWYDSKEMILELFKYNVDFTLPVNKFNHTPVECARNLGKDYLIPLLEELCTRRDRASITISSFFRMVFIRRWYLEEIEHRRAAIKIQSVARMYIFRKNFHILLEERALQLFQSSSSASGVDAMEGSSNENRATIIQGEGTGESTTTNQTETGNGSSSGSNTATEVDTSTQNISNEDTNTTSGTRTTANTSET